VTTPEEVAAEPAAGTEERVERPPLQELATSDLINLFQPQLPPVKERQPLLTIRVGPLSTHYGGALFVFFSDGKIGVSQTKEVEKQLLQPGEHVSELVEGIGLVTLLTSSEVQRLARAAEETTAEAG
jgi:hypothetical protein